VDAERAERLTQGDNFKGNRHGIDAEEPGKASVARLACGPVIASQGVPLAPDAAETYTAHATAGAAVQFNRV
jgi:hypothetical protein